jgi:hypothetical protein
MPILFGLALLAITAAFVWHVAQDMTNTPRGRRVASSRAGRVVRHATHSAASTPAARRASDAIRSRRAHHPRTASSPRNMYRRALAAGGARARVIFPEAFDNPAGGSNSRPHDPPAPRRERGSAPRQDDSPAESPGSPAGVQPSASPETDGGKQPAMSHSNPGSDGADLFSALQQVVSRARAGGLQAKHRAIKTFAEAHDYMSQTMQQFAQEMAEPDQGYPQAIWEPLQQTAQYDRAAATKAAESDAAMTQLSNMQVGELAASPVKAPNERELNSDAASR